MADKFKTIAVTDSVSTVPAENVLERWVDLGGGVYARAETLTGAGQKTAAGSTSVVPSLLAVIALTSPPAALSASSDTTFTFASQVQHVLVQNNSATAVGIEFDVAATAGSYQVPAGAERALDVPVTAIHMFSTAATPVNGSAGSNIVLKGWA